MGAAVPSAPVSKRNDVFDGLRAVAILLVLLRHYLQGMPINGVFDRALKVVAQSSWVGVDLFFVLSGYLITGILLDSKAAPKYFRNFYARRTLRIFPVYYAVLVVLFCLLPALHRPVVSDFAAAHAAWFWLYGANYLTGLNDWPGRAVGHLWSLSIEEHFYLVWPWIVWAMPRRWLMRTTALLLVVIPATRWAAASCGIGPTAIYVMTHFRADSLLWGAVLAQAWREPGMRSRLERHHLKAMAICALVLCVGAGSNAGLSWETWRSAKQGLGYAAIAAGFAMIQVACMTARPRSMLHRALTVPVMLSIGRLSYGIYLFHRPMEVIFVQNGWHPSSRVSPGESAWPYLLAYATANTAATLSIAWCSWHLFEKHILQLKERFRN